jgi:hypothetical protein
MRFIWHDQEYLYQFNNALSRLHWNNISLKVDGNGLSKPECLSASMEDVINIILYGEASLNDKLPTEIKNKCTIGSLIGRNDDLERFVKQRYIWVSRITGGATANRYGNLAQIYVLNYLSNALPDWNFAEKQIPGISQNDRTLISFDIVAKAPNNRYCAIEVSFQVTTNSTIERKSGQAQSRQSILHDANHKIAYIIDGAGNFERMSALETICRYSDCTVSFKDDELNKLVSFLAEMR